MSENVCGFTYKVDFLDDDELFLCAENVDIEVPETDDRESDRDEAGVKADEWAETHLEENGAENYETRLVNAY